jgi:undecaprenyl pyrophosphate synthase
VGQGPRCGASEGHQAGADNIENLLSWCDEVGVEVVTLWLLSTDNLNRPEDELRPLLGIIEPPSTPRGHPPLANPPDRGPGPAAGADRRRG